MNAVPKWAFYGHEKNRRNRRNFTAIEQFHLERAFRIMPHKTEGEGHFMAVLRRREDSGEFTGKRSQPSYIDPKRKKK